MRIGDGSCKVGVIGARNRSWNAIPKLVIHRLVKSLAMDKPFIKRQTGPSVREMIRLKKG